VVASGAGASPFLRPAQMSSRFPDGLADRRGRGPGEVFCEASPLASHRSARAARPRAARPQAGCARRGPAGPGDASGRGARARDQGGANWTCHSQPDRLAAASSLSGDRLGERKFTPAGPPRCCRRGRAEVGSGTMQEARWASDSSGLVLRGSLAELLQRYALAAGHPLARFRDDPAKCGRESQRQVLDVDILRDRHQHRGGLAVARDQDRFGLSRGRQGAQVGLGLRNGTCSVIQLSVVYVWPSRSNATGISVPRDEGRGDQGARRFDGLEGQVYRFGPAARRAALRPGEDARLRSPSTGGEPC
jgi:hypothetical protein